MCTIAPRGVASVEEPAAIPPGRLGSVTEEIEPVEIEQHDDNKSQPAGTTVCPVSIHTISVG